jgi:GNAT superfamily N-acetyltransferase
MRVADDTISLVSYRIDEADGVEANRGDSGFVAPAGPILRPLESRNRDSILDLLRESGQSGCHQPDAIAADTERPSVESNSAPRGASWTVGAYFAEQLAGFIHAHGSPPDGRTEATLFVGAKWRRRGVGTLLLQAAVDWASCRRISTLRFVCARNDWPMRHFAEKFGARLDLVLGQIVADIPLAERINERQRVPSKF